MYLESLTFKWNMTGRIFFLTAIVAQKGRENCGTWILTFRNVQAPPLSLSLFLSRIFSTLLVDVSRWPSSGFFGALLLTPIWLYMCLYTCMYIYICNERLTIFINHFHSLGRISMQSYTCIIVLRSKNININPLISLRKIFLSQYYWKTPPPLVIHLSSVHNCRKKKLTQRRKASLC